MRLEGKVALISGGARGMGAEEALLFAREGAKVVIGDVLEEGRDVAASIPGGGAIFVRLDVTKEEDWRRAVSLAEEVYKRLDILVNNAGVSATGGIEDTTVEEWDRVMAVNAKGVFLGTREAIPAMQRAGGGSIINISSQLGIVAMSESSPQYIASKGAVRLLTKSTATAYAREGIRANSIHPGVIETPMTTPNLLSNEEARQRSIARHPLGRVGQPEDVAYGALFLASDESSFMTGSELVIDGGLSAQ
jgi:cyclopentanol dehydrogenase